MISGVANEKGVRDRAAFGEALTVAHPFGGEGSGAVIYERRQSFLSSAKCPLSAGVGYHPCKRQTKYRYNRPSHCVFFDFPIISRTWPIGTYRGYVFDL
jgi:hypothetical protein